MEGIYMFGQGRKPDKKAWIREAERTYEEVFGERDRIRNDGRLMTFSEIEEEAVREGNQLARWLAASWRARSPHRPRGLAVTERPARVRSAGNPPSGGAKSPNLEVFARVQAP
jgi:hypothetical protein